MTTRRGGGRRAAERRRTTRADVKLSMRLESNAPETDGAQVVTESQNISASGVYCMSSHYLPPLSKVALTIVLPRVPGSRSTQELIKCEGIVVRCEQSAKRGERPYQLACMFSNLDDSLRQRLDAFVTWRNLQALRAAARAAPRTAPARARRARAGLGATRAPARSAKAPKRRTLH
jgi:c-di-GMP-binding flagellar brake protein YcgR